MSAPLPILRTVAYDEQLAELIRERLRMLRPALWPRPVGNDGAGDLPSGQTTVNRCGRRSHDNAGPTDGPGREGTQAGPCGSVRGSGGGHADAVLGVGEAVLPDLL